MSDCDNPDRGFKPRGDTGMDNMLWGDARGLVAMLEEEDSERGDRGGPVAAPMFARVMLSDKEPADVPL